MALLPRGLWALGLTLAGDGEGARRRALRVAPAPAGAAPSTTARLLRQAAAAVLLGALALVAAGVLGMMLTRGVFYGLVDQGPYDDSWGGPSLAGAWLAHFAASLPVDVLAVALLDVLARLHRHLTAPLRAEHRPAWAVPVTVSAGIFGLLFVVAFLHQL